MIPVTPLQKRVDTITSECRSTTQRAEALARNLAARDLVIQQLRDSLCWVKAGDDHASSVTPGGTVDTGK